MKTTMTTIKKIMKAIELNSMGYNVRLEQADEYIIRYEDINNVTCSIYFTSDDSEMIIGYLLSDGSYKWFSTYLMESFDDNSMLLFSLGIKLDNLRKYIEEYVLV